MQERDPAPTIRAFPGDTAEANDLRIVAEATIISLLGGILGIGQATLLCNGMNSNLGGFVPSFTVKPATVLIGLVLALAMGILSGLIPAVQAARLPIARALRETL